MTIAGYIRGLQELLIAKLGIWQYSSAVLLYYLSGHNQKGNQENGYIILFFLVWNNSCWAGVEAELETESIFSGQSWSQLKFVDSAALIQRESLGDRENLLFIIVINYIQNDSHIWSQYRIFSVIDAPDHILRDFTTVAIWTNSAPQSAPLSFVMVVHKRHNKESQSK